MSRFLISSRRDLTCIGGESSLFSSDIPDQRVHIALYITHLLDIGASYSTVNSAIYAIKWMNKIRSHLVSTENSCVRSLPRILQNDNWEASGKKRSRRQ